MFEDAPQVENLINEAMARHPMAEHTTKGQARSDYFEDVHQHLAPLARTLERDNTRLRNALENCRLLAARNRKEPWAKDILRVCSESGVEGSPLRSHADVIDAESCVQTEHP